MMERASLGLEVTDFKAETLEGGIKGILVLPWIFQWILFFQLRGKISVGTLGIFKVGPLGSATGCLENITISSHGAYSHGIHDDTRPQSLTLDVRPTAFELISQRKASPQGILSVAGSRGDVPGLAWLLQRIRTEHDYSIGIMPYGVLGWASTCLVLRQHIFTRTEMLIGYRLHASQEKLVDLGYRPDFVAMFEGKITRLSSERHEQLQSWGKSLPIAYAKENIVHSEVWEPSTEQQVIDYTLRKDSLLSPEEKSSQGKLARNVIICKDCTTSRIA
ncbi:hypothetical protein ARMGADRAFT_1142866 [Armillaria gallica]|uniref:Uncharacterized protein n=1 Tax=Armillaria gallica TaxID=47427 RepID=A0A2H3E482_ARMGA|nr:hypothetical protein ARMGADRAFT_1142866 [Armillaria gallica]